MSGAKVIVFDRIGKFCNLGHGYIVRILQWLLKENVSIILVDNQLDPMVDVAHRIMVMKQGSKEGVFEKGELTRDALAYLIADRSFQEKYKRQNWAWKEAYGRLQIGGMEWTEEYIKTYVDDVEVFSMKINTGSGKEAFQKEHYFLFNVAVGGQWPGYNIDDLFPQAMSIDYIRVYQ